MDFAVDGLEPRELKKGTDVGNASCSHEDGLTVVEGGIGEAVECTRDVTHAEKPKFGW